MLKHCIRGTVIDLSPPPTLTVDDAVPKGLTPSQAEEGRNFVVKERGRDGRMEGVKEGSR